MRGPVELAKAYRLLNHGPVTLVASAAGGERNVMAAAWVMPLDFDPPKLAAVIAAGTRTRRLVEASGEAVISVPVAAQAELVMAVGSTSGEEGDKFERYGIATSPASKVAAPLVEGCAAWLECRVLPEPRLQDAHDLFLLEVVAAWADDAVFPGGRWRFPDDAHRTLHHVAGGAFFLTGESKVVPKG
jgi:flavin reductase (DIM6/NTAB) family NADH-FMN oxidoreductase RutF